MKVSLDLHQSKTMQRNAKQASQMLKQLASPTRLLILCNLVEGEKTVTELLVIVKLSQSALSQHLAGLRAARLVASEKRGQKVYYRLCSMEAQAILSMLHLIYCR